jgi:hypothetical protein
VLSFKSERRPPKPIAIKHPEDAKQDKFTQLERLACEAESAGTEFLRTVIETHDGLE